MALLKGMSVTGKLSRLATVIFSKKNKKQNCVTENIVTAGYDIIPEVVAYDILPEVAAT